MTMTDSQDAREMEDLTDTMIISLMEEMRGLTVGNKEADAEVSPSISEAAAKPSVLDEMNSRSEFLRQYHWTALENRRKHRQDFSCGRAARWDSFHGKLWRRNLSTGNVRWIWRVCNGRRFSVLDARRTRGHGSGFRKREPGSHSYAKGLLPTLVVLPWYRDNNCKADTTYHFYSATRATVSTKPRSLKLFWHE